MGDVYGLPLEQVITGIVLLIMLLLLLIVILWVRLRKMQKKYRSMMGGITAGSLEEAVIHIQQKLQMIERADRERETELNQQREKIANLRGNTEIIRYNAFADRGSDLSFSIAFLNESLDGLVLSGIHNRDQMYVYAKPVEKGTSTYSLTPEERQVIDRVGGRTAPAPIPAAAGRSAR